MNPDEDFKIAWIVSNNIKVIDTIKGDEKMNDDVELPQTLEEYDALVRQLCANYGFKDERHVAGVVSVATRQLPNHQSSVSLGHLAGWVKKSLANHIAAYKAEIVKAEGQIDALVAMIEKDPNDQQAKDNLMLAAQHNEYAKEQWAKYDLTNEHSQAPVDPNAPNVFSISGASK